MIVAVPIVLLCTLTLTCFFFMIPVLMKNIINRKLGLLTGYKAEIQRIRFRLLQGSAIIYDFTFRSAPDLTEKRTAINVHVPLVIIQLSWKKLFSRNVVANLQCKNPSLEILHELDSAFSNNDNWYAVFKQKFDRAIRFNIQLDVENGRVSYRNNHMPGVDPLVLSSITISVKNFSNIPQLQSSTNCQLNAAIFDGNLTGHLVLNPLADLPTLSGKIALTGGNLRHMNPFLRKYLRFDVQAGEFDFQLEVNVVEGFVQGYMEPVICAVQVQGREDHDKGFLNKVWEWGVSMTIRGIGKGKRDKVSLRIPLTGSIETIHVSLADMIPAIIGKLFLQIVPV